MERNKNEPLYKFQPWTFLERFLQMLVLFVLKSIYLYCSGASRTWRVLCTSRLEVRRIELEASSTNSAAKRPNSIWQNESSKRRGVEPTSNFTCPICIEPVLKETVMGPDCGHVICSNCEVSWTRELANQNPPGYRCPTCNLRSTPVRLFWFFSLFTIIVIFFLFLLLVFRLF